MEIKKIKLISGKELQDQAKLIAAEICTRYKSELVDLIKWEMEQTEDVQIINILARLKQRAITAWLHTAA